MWAWFDYLWLLLMNQYLGLFNESRLLNLCPKPLHELLKWHWSHPAIKGWGFSKPISSVLLFCEFLALSKHTLAVEYNIHIWQVLPQLGWSNTCQIYMWFKESYRYFCRIKNLLTEKLTTGGLVTPPQYNSIDCIWIKYWFTKFTRWGPYMHK